MLPTLLRDPGISLTVSQQVIHTRGYSSPGLAGSPQPQHVGLPDAVFSHGQLYVTLSQAITKQHVKVLPYPTDHYT
jgi:hypothetical protein